MVFIFNSTVLLRFYYTLEYVVGIKLQLQMIRRSTNLAITVQIADCQAEVCKTTTGEKAC